MRSLRKPSRGFLTAGIILLAAVCSPQASMAGIAECKNSGSPDLPDGFIELGGSVIGMHDGTEYGLGHVCRGKTHQLILRRFVSWDKQGKESWENLGRLVLPRLRTDELLVYGTWSTCRRGAGADPDPAIIAIVAKTKEPEFKNIRKAWRANVESRNIARIPTAGIVCANDGYGL
jgi:hypothetical protein